MSLRLADREGHQNDDKKEDLNSAESVVPKEKKKEAPKTERKRPQGRRCHPSNPKSEGPRRSIQKKKRMQKSNRRGR